jgi:hypothetical protein
MMLNTASSLAGELLPATNLLYQIISHIVRFSDVILKFRRFVPDSNVMVLSDIPDTKYGAFLLMKSPVFSEYSLTICPILMLE